MQVLRTASKWQVHVPHPGCSCNTPSQYILIPRITCFCPKACNGSKAYWASCSSLNSTNNGAEYFWFWEWRKLDILWLLYLYIWLALYAFYYLRSKKCQCHQLSLLLIGGKLKYWGCYSFAPSCIYRKR